MQSLEFVYDGWDGYNRSLLSAVAGLSSEQLDFRAKPNMRSVGEIFLHIADGRVDWFQRIDAPHSRELADAMLSREAGKRLNADELIDWLERTWQMVAETLAQWTVDDLAATYRHEYQGQVYAVSRQWTIWRIQAHDIHHGGQISALLAMQGIEPLELTLLGGHLTEPPLAHS